MTRVADPALDRFREGAIAYCDAIAMGNSKVANREVAAVADVYRSIRGNEAATQGLLEMLSNDDVRLRYMAAVYALDTAPSDGERALLDIAQGKPSPLRLMAQTALAQWRAGTMRF